MSLAKLINEKPLDFLMNEIKVGDWIVYPTGGTSARMVLARVTEIKNDPDKKTWDGYRGASPWRINVNRYKEGTKSATGEHLPEYLATRADFASYWKIDTSRKVGLDQLHRVVIIPDPCIME